MRKEKKSRKFEVRKEAKPPTGLALLMPHIPSNFSPQFEFSSVGDCLQ